jgi:hypothetical protein
LNVIVNGFLLATTLASLNDQKAEMNPLLNVTLMFLSMFAVASVQLRVAKIKSPAEAAGLKSDPRPARSIDDLYRKQTKPRHG